MPGSPASVASDYSQSSSSTFDYCSQPTTPTPEELSKKVALKPALRRHGSPRTAKRVSWDPNTVFETRPIQRKRSHSAMLQTQQSGSEDSEMCAPIPTKKAKIAELETHAAFTTALHQLSFSPSPSTGNSFAEASRTVIPSFNFDAALVETSAAQSAPAALVVAATPSFVPFSFTPKRRPVSVHSRLHQTTQ